MSSAVSVQVICVSSSSVGLYDCWTAEVKPGSNRVTDVEGGRGVALWDHRSWRFRLPVVGDGVGGRDCDMAGRKCISSVITANWRFSLVTPKTRPVKKLCVFMLSDGKFA